MAVTNFRAGYVVRTELPYAAADITVTVTASASGYDTMTVTRTVASSTNDITIDIELLAEGSAVAYNSHMPLPARAGAVKIYSLSGRYLGQMPTGGSAAGISKILPAARQGFAGQPYLIVVRGDNGKVIERKMVVPTH